MHEDLELSIMSCLLCKPKLMENIIVEEKHFKKHKGLWKFMNAFYDKFKTFDISLMYSVCKDKYHIVNYIELLIDYEPAPSNFMKYQERLIEIYEESEKEVWIINKIYDLSNLLMIRKINLKEFEEKLKNIYEKAEKIFKEN
ncbi:MAG: hypothetical protein IJ690_02010 [Clostridia bacterium]|nr:hypothetical protein [Clostridia bacterium]MBR1653716.1 hypothetical protein [Clostridia bacterium]